MEKTKILLIHKTMNLNIIYFLLQSREVIFYFKNDCVAAAPNLHIYG